VASESRFPSFRHRLEHAAVVGVGTVVRFLPWRVAVACGRGLGLAFYALDRTHRRLTIANLAAGFPHRPAAEHVAIARRVFAHFGELLVEFLRFASLTHDEIRARVEFDGEERVEEAHALGRGVILITGHFGFWEINALAHGLMLRPIALVARPLDNPLLHALLERVRTSTGNHVIYRHRGLRRIMRALAANEGVAMLIDQHIQAADSVVVDFFDRPAATTSAVAAIALRTGAPVIPVFALPVGRGRYRMVYEHPVQPPGPDAPDPVREFTQRCTDVLEMYVRRYPHLWLWMHRRWRDPADLRAAGMFPAVGAAERTAEPAGEPAGDGEPDA
jgi:KDO2-lipid IV(A) lauroyltransferase